MPALGRFLESIGLKKKINMTTETKPTTIVKHRYEKVDILEKCLEKFGFKKGEWKIIEKNRPGIEIQLPEGKELTPDQEKEIHDAYVEEHKRRLNNKEDDAEDE